MSGLETITRAAELTGVLGGVLVGGLALSFVAWGFLLFYAAGEQNARGMRNTILRFKDGKSGLRFWRDCLTKVDVRDFYRVTRNPCKYAEELSQKYPFLSQYLIQ